MQQNSKNIKLNYLLEYALDSISEVKMLSLLKKEFSIHKLNKELDIIEKSLEYYTKLSALAPPKHLKTNLLNKIDKIYKFPPILKPNSKIEDYSIWLNNVKKPSEFNNMHMEVIGDYKEAKMVIAWVKDGEPEHDHHGYSENFLIIEGACTATIDGITKNYGVGDYVHFPINKKHGYKVTSKIPMKVIACLDLKVA